MIHAMNQTMLGAPGTLLRPASSFDLFGTSIFEGLSIPPAAVQPPPAAIDTAPETSPSLHLPVLALALFHPPFR